MMMKQKALTQKNTILKNAQANAASNFFKRVFFFSHPKKEFFFNRTATHDRYAF